MDDKLIQKLIDIYTKAQQDLINTIAEKEAKGNVTVYQKTLLKQIGQQLGELDKQSRELSYDIVEKYYKDTMKEVSAIIETNPEEDFNNFVQLHTKAIKILAFNAYSNLNQANNFVGRRLNDAIRQAGIDAITQKIATGQTVKECKKNLVNALIDEGINGIKDKRGRMISLQAYADVVARSTTAETTNTATTNQLSSLGYDLVKMSSHNTTCPICSVYQSRVYSISGKDKRFPPLDTAFNGEYANIHPRCRHRIFPYIPDLADDLNSDIEMSNRSFEIDKESKKSIEDYNKQQTAKAQMRNDMNQYQRYKLALGNNAPKSFAAFRRMKYSNSGKYNELESQYRSLRLGGEG